MASTTLHLRIDEDDLTSFKAECATRYNRDHNDLLREMIVAATEGRLKIVPSEGQMNLFSDIYTNDKEK